MNSTKKLTEGAMMCALVGVLLFINRQSAGLIDFLLYWIVPLPVIMYTIKYGLKESIIVAVSVVLLAFVTGMPTGIYYTIVGVVVGLLYGFGVRRNFEHHQLLLISCSISTLSYFLMMYVFAALFGYDLMDDIAYMNQVMNEILSISNMAMPMGFEDFIPKMIILSNIVMGILEGLLIHMLSYLVLTRFKIKIKKMKPLSTIRLPKIWGYILTIGYLVPSTLISFGITTINTDILYMIMLVCMLVLIGNGYLCILSILAYYKKKKFMWLLMFSLLPPFSTMLYILGIIDSLINIRDKQTVLKK